jgi:hypothetical protein
MAAGSTSTGTLAVRAAAINSRHVGVVQQTLVVILQADGRRAA